MKIFYCIAPFEIFYGLLFIWLENNRPTSDSKVLYRVIPQAQKLNEEELEGHTPKGKK